MRSRPLVARSPKSRVAVALDVPVSLQYFSLVSPPRNSPLSPASSNRFSTLGGGFLGGLTSGKYCKLTGASKATATRDLADLAAKGLLRIEGVGKATRYAIAIDRWVQPAN